MSQPLLSVNGLMMRFGGLLAVNNVNLELYPQEIVSLIGPNGAGKTTVFNCLTGFYKPTGGTILLRDQHLEGLPGQQIARMGVVRTFQHVRLFREMTVIENLLVAQHQQLKTGLFSGLLKTPSFRRAQSEALDRAATWLERIGLLEHANRQASNLAYGDQRRLEIARCMVTQPEILMLDEPAAGLNPKETKELDELIAELRNQHLEGLPGQQIARMGVVRTFQHVRLFREMTVIENLLVAQHQQLKTGLFSGLLKTPSFRRAQSEALDRAATWLERIGLLEHANRQASNLAYGDQRRLEIARCMVTQPEILMLDEPAAGLNPKETKELDELIAELRNHHNTTILLIEHDMKLVMGISDRIYVVNQGTPLANGTPEQIRNNPDVIRAYLGEA